MRVKSIFVSDKVVRSMTRLYPEHELKIRLREYYREKVKLSLVIVLTGVVLYAAASHTGSEHVITDGRIKRNDCMGGDRRVTLEYELKESGINKDAGQYSDNAKEYKTEDLNEKIYGRIEVNISERRYSDEETEMLFDEFTNVLQDEMLNGNESPDHVTSDLNFPESIDGYPFTVTYRTDNPSVLTGSGTICAGDIPDDGETVCITATVKYNDFISEYIIPVNVCSKDLTYEEFIDSSIEEVILYEDGKSAEDEYIVLPEMIGDMPVTFYEKEDSRGIYILVLAVAAAATVFFVKDRDIEKEVIKREKELKKEYCGFVNRFTLFYSAGIPVKNIFIKMCSRYERERDSNGIIRPLYEELLLVRSRLYDGVSQTAAYEEFADRVSLPEYRTFISLINRSISKGNSEIIQALKEETFDAQAERLNVTKKLVEEAGTKLLMPMFMMLTVVMVMVIFPAFCSFK